MKAVEKIWAFNKIAGDKVLLSPSCSSSPQVSLWRGLNDVRSSQCKALTYNTAELPKASVVIIFNNEALSSLLRTVWSVLDRTPEELLHEVRGQGQGQAFSLEKSG